MITIRRNETDHGVVESFGWLGSDDSLAFASFVEPGADAGARPPVVIVGPYGIESLGADRTLRDLGRRLAAAGHLVVHVEAPDVGDGSGNERHGDRVGRWVAAVRAAIAEGRRRSGCDAIVIGVRLGALIAACAADDHEDSVQALALWAPVLKGRLYVRELKLASASSAHATPASAPLVEGDLEAGGFVMPSEMAAALAAVDLAEVKPRIARALVIDRDDVASASALAAVVAAWTAVGISVEAADVAGYASAQLDDPERGDVAADVNATLTRWCGDLAARPVASAATAAGAPLDHVRVTTDEGIVEERLVTLGPVNELLGIVTRPDGPVAPGPALLLLTTGSNVRSGPGRVGTTMARHWAAQGRIVVRYDRRGIGGSGTYVPWSRSPGFTVGNAYAEQHVADTLEALRWMRSQGHDEVIVVGMCSGAWSGYRALVDHRPADAARPVGLVSINQVIWDDIDWGGDGESPAIAAKAGRELRRSVLDPERWKALLRGEIPIRANVSRLGRLVMMKARRAATSSRPNRFEEQLGQIQSAGVWQLLLFNEDELGPAYLQLQAPAKVDELRRAGLLRREDRAGAGHTFSPQAAKRWLLERIDDELARRAPVGDR